MDPKRVLQADYLDIIYDHRNKEYGGYELRKHYNRRAGKATLFLFATVGALISLSFVNSHEVVVPAKNDKPVVMTDVNIAPPKVPLPPVPPVAPPPPPPPPAEVKTAMITVPKIVDDKDVPDNLRPIENKKIGDAQPGLTTSNGVVGTTGGDTKSTGGAGAIATELPPNQPKVWVQQMPQFDGQMEAYISSHIRYPEVARNQNISGRVVVQFVVNEDGSVTDAKVVHGIGGGCDEEALRMVAGMPRWKPGKQNGIPVKVYFTIPIKFVLN